MISFDLLKRFEAYKVSKKISFYFRPKSNKLVDIHLFCDIITKKLDRQDLYLPVLTKWLARSGSVRTEINQLSWITFLSSLLEHLNDNDDKVNAIKILHETLPPISLTERQIRYAVSQISEHLPDYLWPHLQPFLSNHQNNASEIKMLMNEYLTFSIHEKALDLAKSYLKIVYTLLNIDPDVKKFLFDSNYQNWPTLVRAPIEAEHHLFLLNNTLLASESRVETNKKIDFL